VTGGKEADKYKYKYKYKYKHKYKYKYKYDQKRLLLIPTIKRDRWKGG